MTFRTTLSIAALSLSLTSCLPSDDKDDEESGCSPFDPSCRGVYGTGWYSWDSGYGGWDDPDVGPISGIAAVYIQEAGCDVLWDLSGPQCSGCDLGWDADLDYTGGSCGGGGDTSGTLLVEGRAVYWNSDYWGYAAVGGGSISWATVGYVYGAGGYTYTYYGSATY